MKAAAKLNRHQKSFFRNLRTHPEGLPPACWPRPVTMLRWLEQEAFQNKLAELGARYAFASAMGLRQASASAAVKLVDALDDDRLDAVNVLLRVLSRERDLLGA